jgi:antirestriction protein ArdC
MTTKPDIYETITARIIANLESAGDVKMPWTAPAFQEPRRVTGQVYRGINWLMLATEQDKRGFIHPTWMTFKQAQDLGGMVRKGEKGTPITFAKPITEEATDSDGETRDVRTGGCILRGYTVFNVAQIDGLPDKFSPAALSLSEAAKEARDERNEAILRKCGAHIVEGGARAYYNTATDIVFMPDFALFHSAGGFLATLAHELTHWTADKARCDRDLSTYGQNIAARAKEELIAEIGSAFICGRLGITGAHIEDHAAYVANWLQALKNDKRHIFKAATAAQRAADYVLAASGCGQPAEPVRDIADAPATPPAQFALL